jgi:ribose transport system substrate-binding protein
MHRFIASRFAAASVAAFASVIAVGTAQASNFVLIEKALADPFAVKIKAGCEAAAKDLGDTCVFLAPSSTDDTAQIQMLNDTVTRGADGIGIAPRNPKAVVPFVRKAKAAGIPVIAFDSDVLPENADLRSTFVGTNNYDFGVTLAKFVQGLKSKGGTVCIQSGTPGALNLDARVQGVRDTLGGGSKNSPIAKLTGQNGWIEPSGCPIYNMDDITVAAQQMGEVLTAHPDLSALIAVGGWAQYAPEAYKKALAPVMDRVKSKDFVISFGDAEAPQMPLLKAGLSDYNVGQNPYQIGYKAIQALHDLKAGKTVAPLADTGFVTCTPDQADTCGK